jgi:hypothetical protein
MHRCLRLPGSGKKPFFPLGPCRSTGATRPGNFARVRTAGLAACAPSAIIRTPSPRCGSSWPEPFSPNSFAVHFVAVDDYDIYNTVALAREEWECLSLGERTTVPPVGWETPVSSVLVGNQFLIIRRGTDRPEFRSRLGELDSDLGQSVIRRAKVCNRAFPLFQSFRIHDKEFLPHCHLGG